MAVASGSAVASLEISPPAEIAVGRGSAFVIGGYCYHRTERTRELAVQVGGSRQQVERFRLPRDDVYEGLEPGDPARAHAYRSGFVALVDLQPVDRPQRLEVELVVGLAGGGEARVPAGSVDVRPDLPPPAGAPPPEFPDLPGPRVAICMATYEPPGDLLQIQLESIRQQTHGNWICLISDDRSSDEGLGRLAALTDGDPRFVVSRSESRLGFYRNFERALSMAPASADFVTFCDQDDRWHPAKLERLLGGIGDAQLVYSDARIVSPGGELVRPSYWTERRNNYTNYGSLLLANSVTGAASLFRRDLLDDALPFPPRLARAFHDHWLAVVAMSRGQIAYLDEPLYDYVQHGDAVIGHSMANKKPRTIRRHLIERLRNPTSGSRIVYFYDWHQELLFCEVLRLRCWPRMTAAKRRTLRRLLSADSGVAGLTWLLGRRTRRLWGHDETLDRELFYAYALVRRRAVSAWTAGRKRPKRLLPRDVAIPPDPGREK
ncbi:MAG TPA: glycosyltransferase [Solirubrobacterales bacterium]|nr:glycosyltransferase [Solirubrobacterales bacterium]